MIATIRRRATTCNVIAMFAAICALAAISHGLVLPAYRAVASGFDPFDLQLPLTRDMVAIQRGAFADGAGQVYLTFMAFDVLFRILIAAFYVLLWAWIMARSPRRLARDGVFLIPVLAVFCNVAAKAGFLILIFSNAHVPHHDITASTLMVHRIRFFLDDADLWVITPLLMAFMLYFRGRALAVKKADQ